MASATAEELEVKNSTESAQTFIDWFYTSVSDRKPLASFYVNNNAKYSAVGAAADLSINGMVCAKPADFEALLARQAGAQNANGAAATNGTSSVSNPHRNTSSSSSSSTPTFRVRYDVDGFDVHVLNPQFRLACPDAILQRMTPGSAAYETTTPQQLKQLQQKMVSLLVQVTGHVQYGAGKEAPRGAFTEVFVLVPNWDALASGPRTPRGLRNYLILSQNFRAL
ncbi:hypothetical protein SPBR_07852 [Sporothrix brasiliensis 5110]|uniref:NTF2 domain-containing protein n=1 Tax=Sporothrix brasiliensis 5110 TaxID=1398154 RepID=A0A0C2IMV5_9PEZI|nr:uncharacterized protein SPBR_07852 [Sporothrix brasiliensis 5110]KIH88350.1 hypothetical protein SPBR_07852 [Sporothrix brasiliensis 5110]